jgi:hypothetical protein
MIYWRKHLGVLMRFCMAKVIMQWRCRCTMCRHAISVKHSHAVWTKPDFIKMEIWTAEREGPQWFLSQYAETNVLLQLSPSICKFRGGRRVQEGEGGGDCNKMDPSSIEEAKNSSWIWKLKGWCSSLYNRVHMVLEIELCFYFRLQLTTKQLLVGQVHMEKE